MAHHPGKFVWFELNTKDVEAAKKFYGELIGWHIAEQEMNGMKYTMLSIGERPVGGFIPAQGAAHWISYLSVEDVDESIAAVKKAGGKLAAEAMDFPNVGRFGKVTDPRGGAFFVFRSEQGDADDGDQVQGDWHWNELWTDDADKSVAFYTKIFGFGTDAMDMPTGTYHVLKKGETPRAGIMKSPVEGVPVNWLPYVKVDDADAAVARAKKLGGTVMSEPADVPNVGRIAIIKDPEGAALGIITPASR